MINVNDIITEALTCEKECTNTYPLKDFSIEELESLCKKAYKEDINIGICTEYSNFRQGVFVDVKRKGE